MRHFKKDISIAVEYSIGKQDAARGTFQGGVPEPAHLDELSLNVSDDTTFDEVQERDVPNGLWQINMRGSVKAYRALARYLLALCEYTSSPEVSDPDYHDHFDEVRDADGDVRVHLIVHGPWE